MRKARYEQMLSALRPLADMASAGTAGRDYQRNIGGEQTLFVIDPHCPLFDDRR